MKPAVGFSVQQEVKKRFKSTLMASQLLELLQQFRRHDLKNHWVAGKSTGHHGFT
jgi:hypothetical protein